MHEVAGNSKACTLVVMCFAFLQFSVLGFGVTSCHVVVQSAVEVRGSAVTLADLLRPDTCPEILRAAEEFRLGAVPSEGSVRVLRGEDIDASLRGLRPLSQKSVEGMVLEPAPARIVVRRAGLRASCNDVEATLRTASRSAPSNGFPVLPGAECGAGNAIPHDAALQVVRRLWDHGAQRWIYDVRCIHSGECVPFVLSLSPESAANDHLLSQDHWPLGTAASFQPSRNQYQTATDLRLVRRGQTATLLWTQDGIRVSVPAVCMDDGAQGATVRARIVHGGRIVRAKAVGAVQLEIGD